MNRADRFDDVVSDWLHVDAEHRVSDHLDAVLRRTSTERQRPAWSSLERWLPVQLTFTSRLQPNPRVGWAIAILIALVLAAVAVVAGVGQRRVPHFGSQTNGAIAFVDGVELKFASADGSNVRLAGALPDGVESLTYSPDGTHLAYRTTTIPAAIIVAAADGSHPVEVTAGKSAAKADQPTPGGPFAWAPDSRRLVFTWKVDATTRDLAVVDADGSHLTPLLADAQVSTHSRFDPAWSPDGQWIAYYTSEAGKDAALNVVHPDGTEARRLPTSPVDLEYVETSWAPDPDKHRLAYVAGDANGDAVMIFDLATGHETRVGTGFFASWAPDATRLAWWDGMPGVLASPSEGGIRVASVDDVLAGRNLPTTIFPAVNNAACYYGTSDIGICGPADWSPDSQWVFGPDPTGGSIVFSTLDAPRTVRTIKLAHRSDLSNGAQGYLAWQPVAP